MSNRIKEFYEKDCFENLILPQPFQDFLAAEEGKIRGAVCGGRLLEVGLGNGRAISIVTDRVDEYYGIEISERLYGEAVEQYGRQGNIKLIFGDARSLMFDDGAFDIIMAIWNTIGNLGKERGQVLSEMARVAKPGGKILISVLSRNALEPYLEMLRVNDLQTERITRNRVYLRDGLTSERFSAAKLGRILRQFDLDIKIEPLTEIGWWCECTKEAN